MIVPLLLSDHQDTLLAKGRQLVWLMSSKRR